MPWDTSLSFLDLSPAKRKAHLDLFQIGTDLGGLVRSTYATRSCMSLSKALCGIFAASRPPTFANGDGIVVNGAAPLWAAHVVSIRIWIVWIRLDHSMTPFTTL